MPGGESRVQRLDPPRHRNGPRTPHWAWPAGRQPTQGEHERTPFGRVAVLTVAGTAIPGLGLIAARRWGWGGLVLAVFGTAGLIVVLWALVDPQSVTAMAVRPSALRVLAVLLVVLAALWVSVVVASHLALRTRPTRSDRLLGAGLVAVLSFAVAAPLLVAARYGVEQADLIDSVFRSEDQSNSATRPTLQPAPGEQAGAPGQPAPLDAWRDKPRLNVLLLGGDADEGRVGTRTDTVILASIDTASGDTTLISVPRNTARMPFPIDSALRRYYPYGFTDGNGSNPEFFLNAIYNNVPALVPGDVLGATDNLGADALKLAVGEAVGLDVDYYALVNLEGFEALVNALGGIRLNVNTYIPIGGNTDRGIPPSDWIEPGENKLLKGKQALWYARGRWGSNDFDRMDRQRCVIDAVIDQANPANLVTRYQQIARAGQDLVQTDMPQEVLPMMVELGLRAKDGNVRSVVFKTGESGFVSANPDFARMRSRVRAALTEAKSPRATPAPPTTTAPKASTTARPKPSSVPVNRPAQSDNLADSCAWQPLVAASARRP